MADNENGDKTELPTDKRRQEAREQGNVARSADLTAAALLLAAALALQWGGTGFFEVSLNILRGSFEESAWTSLDEGLVLARARDLTLLVLPSVALMWGVLIFGVLAANFSQVGFHMSTEVLSLKWERLNPIPGLQKLISMQGLVRLFGSLLKLTVLGCVSGWFIWETVGNYLQFSHTELAPAAAALGETMVTLAYQLAGALLALAVLDYGFQYWKFEQDLKMTKQELREEMRNMDGDPHIRQRRREAHRKLADSRQLTQIPNADAVIVNPTHFAIAIRYDGQKMAAPVVVAKGAGPLADRIRQIATEHGVPIVERTPLARALFKQVKVGHPIPTDLYAAVAEILAYVYRLRNKTRRAA